MIMNAKSVYIIIICLQEHQITNPKKTIHLSLNTKKSMTCDVGNSGPGLEKFLFFIEPFLNYF
jgi:hypothetical protein